MPLWRGLAGAGSLPGDGHDHACLRCRKRGQDDAANLVRTETGRIGMLHFMTRIYAFGVVWRRGCCSRNGHAGAAGAESGGIGVVQARHWRAACAGVAFATRRLRCRLAGSKGGDAGPAAVTAGTAAHPLVHLNNVACELLACAVTRPSLLAAKWRGGLIP